MDFPSRNLTNQYISLSYQDVVQRYTPGATDTASYFLDGLGSVIAYIPTSSLGQQLVTIDQPSQPSLFNGNRTIKRSPYTSLNVGGTDVNQFLENFFFPFISATIAISSGGTTYYETGTTQNVSVSTTITANDETIFGEATVKKDLVNWNSSSVPPYTFAFTDTGVTADHSYISYVPVDNNGSPTVILSNIKSVSFIYPYLWGMSTTPGLEGTSLYTSLTKSIQTQGNKTVSMIGNVVYMYFCYPATYPVLTSILDPNTFEAFGNFEYSASVPVTSSGLGTDWMTNYKVYRTILVSDPNGNYQFKY
jgi:hypothetical protein